MTLAPAQATRFLKPGHSSATQARLLQRPLQTLTGLLMYLGQFFIKVSQIKEPLDSPLGGLRLGIHIRLSAPVMDLSVTLETRLFSSRAELHHRGFMTTALS
jgi:hypothetical protein